LQIASDALKGRVFEVSLADLQGVSAQHDQEYEGVRALNACIAITYWYSTVTTLFLSHLQNEADAYRKIRLRVEDVQGRNCLTNFWVSIHFTQENDQFCFQPVSFQGGKCAALRPCSAVRTESSTLHRMMDCT
jgi:ribosomal protein S3AE